jgi:hypothetical protein
MAPQLYLFLFMLGLSGINTQTGPEDRSLNEGPGYNLSVPDRIYTLPMVLQEVSGLTAINASTVACIQDEYGIVFFYDLNGSKIDRTLVFGTEGDYEDVERAGGTLYVIRSDELLVEITNFVSEDFEVTSYPAKVPRSNIEALCYDRNNDWLLITPRDVSNDEDARFIYAFDRITDKVLEEPVISLDIKQIEKFANDNDVKVPMKGTKGKKKPDINLKISAMAINPVTHKLFVLDGPERLLLVFDLNGKIEWLERLDKDLFPQAEGITFLVNNDMIISNEGRGKEATLLRYSYN